MDAQVRYSTARCRRHTGSVSDLEVLDLSEAGCLVDKRMIGLRQGERVLIKLRGLRYMPATVTWIEEGEAGLTFEQPLYRPVLDHLKRTLARRMNG